MNNRYLFRGKRVDNGEWVEGDLLTLREFSSEKTRKISIGGAWDRGLYVVDSYDVIPKTVGQWTGLTDGNNRRVFEGDIVIHVSEPNRKAVVVFENGRFSADEGGIYIHNRPPLGYLEVIGNIHDNAEEL